MAFLVLSPAQATLRQAQDATPLLATIALGQPLATNWEPAGFGGAGNFLSVHFDPRQPNVVYAASDVSGVFRSADWGDHWEMRSRGLGNYEVSSFAVDPFDSNTLFAGAGAFATSNRAGIYVSRDAGLTWQHLPSTAANRITFRKYRTAEAVALDPAQRGVILSGSRGNGIWRSTDSGSSWVQVYAARLTSAPLFNDGTIADDPTFVPYPAPVSVAVFDPVISTTVYAGLDGVGVVKSTARGVPGSWQPINSGLPAEAPVKYLAVGSGQVLYAAVGPRGVYKSTNGGSSWQAANGSLPLGSTYQDPWASSVAVHPANPAIAYLTLVTYDYPSVWKTTDGGATWVPKGNVAYDPVNNPTRSWATDRTLSWQVALSRSDPSRLFSGDYWSILRSDDGGEHWTDKIRGAQNTCVTSLVADTDHPVGQPDTLFATHMDAGLLTSTNQGTTWSAVLPRQSRDPTLAGHFWRFATARVGGTKYYYTTSDPWDQGYGQVLRSTDGVTWSTVFTRTRPPGRFMDGAMLGLAVDPSQPSTLYVTQDGGQVFKSINSGDTWAPTTGQPGGSAFTYALTVDGAGRVFAGTLTQGLWRSTDGGASWQRVLITQGTIFHLGAAPGAIYASAGDANLYRSSDGGTTWQRLTNFSPGDDGDGVGDQGMAIAIDPGSPAHLLFSRMDTWHPADAGPGIVESTDGGVSWTPRNAGLGILNLSSLSLGLEGSLFAGTWCGSLWRLRPPGATPTPTPTPLQVRDVRASPNPFNPANGTTISYTLSKAATPTLVVLDGLLSPVRVITATSRPGGPGAFFWNGRNQAGQVISSGLYVPVVVASAGAESAYGYTLAIADNGVAPVVSNPVASPNPIIPPGGTTVSYQVSKGSVQVLLVLDAQGSEVRRIIAGYKKGGPVSIYWDGRNQAGNYVPNGNYILVPVAVDLLGRVGYNFTVVRVGNVAPISSAEAQKAASAWVEAHRDELSRLLKAALEARLSGF